MVNPIPFFTVVVPLYNREILIGETLDSIARQKFRDFELVIVNDGSTDNSAKVAEELIFSLGLVGKVLSIPNAGHGAARDYGICHSNGLYIVPLDSDDIWLPDFLAVMHSAICVVGSEASSKLFFTDFCQFFESNESDVRKSDTLKHIGSFCTESDGQSSFLHTSNLFDYLLIEQPIFWGCVSFSRELYSKIGPIGKYVPGKSGSPVEWEFFLRCAFNSVEGVYLPVINTRIRRHSGNMSSEFSVQLEGELEVLKLVLAVYSLNDAQKKKIEEQILIRTYDCAYHYFSLYNFKNSRNMFAKIVTKYKPKSSIFYLLLTLMPVEFVKKLKISRG